MNVEREVGTDEELNTTIQAELERVAQGLCGEPVPIDYRWSGIMGFTRDRLPLVGTVPERKDIAIAAGYSGHGLAMAFNASRHAVHMLLGEASAYADLFAPSRFDH